MGDTVPASQDPIREKYNEERAKRLRSDGGAQFITIPSFSASRDKNEKLARFAADPWDTELEEAQKRYGVRSTLPDHAKILIVGAGYGGLYFAVKLLEAGFSVDDLLIVDSAGGFGGTWYWNRYPGLMCDVESYIYMPLLEETGYMPKHKYATGSELRGHANMIAEKWGLHRASVFKTLVKGMKWNDEKKSWEVDAMQLNDDTDNKRASISADFVILATGLLNVPKMPDIPGIEKFQGHSFHTSRWDYEYTGGSSEDPKMTNLKDKKVGVVGTGATAIQVVPQLAKWAGELYVFQRTPSSVDVRGNRETDEEWWNREVTSRGKGWQRERMENYNAFVSNVNPPPSSNMVSDGWTDMQSYCVLVGGPNNLHPDFVSTAHELDLPRQERVRARVDGIVKDETTAESLKAWYAGWCKRPCFHDEYLPAFNEPHVHLVDTDGHGVDSLTENGIVVRNSNGSTEYNDFDLIVFSTGFNLPSRNSPAARASFPVTGRSGLDMEHKWTVHGAGTLHGVVSRDFPNLFFPGPNQAGAAPNQSYTLNVLSTHVAYIISQTVKKGSTAPTARNGNGDKQRKVTVEPSEEAEQAWASRIVSMARGMAALAGCTPGYINGEAGREGHTEMSKETMAKLVRLSNWGLGIANYVEVLEAWRGKGDMEGLVVEC